MRHLLISLVALLILLPCFAALAQDDDGVNEEKFTLWLGAHYTDFTDNKKKVGEYQLGLEEVWPEGRLQYIGVGNNSRFWLDGHFYDRASNNAYAEATVSDAFKLSVDYRSLIHQENQDLLEALSAREWLGDRPGGKIVTHEIQDPFADYNTTRREILTQLDVLLSRQNNVRLYAAHKGIFEEGEEQSLANSHCASCHIVSRTAEVQNNTHEVEAGIQHDLAQFTLGYEFGYRKYKSDAATPVNFYDKAQHPVRGDAVAEFGSRLIYDGVHLPYSQEPETEKVGGKVRAKGALNEKTHMRAAGAYARTENKNTDLQINTWSGAFSLTRLMGPRTRATLRATGVFVDADDPMIVIAEDWREGRPPAGDQFHPNFSYTRFSSLDRTDTRANLEVSHRLNPRMVVAGLVGVERIKRDDYPEADYTTNRFIGQAKLRYRRGLNFNGWIKYRFEKTSDPFTSARGLFEASGNDLQPLGPFVFYFQREDLRYQEITTEPTDYHEVELRANLRLTSQLSANLGFEGIYDKNGELDSLDVEHTTARPSASLTLTPAPKWVFTGGYTWLYNQSRGPLAVALFDG